MDLWRGVKKIGLRCIQGNHAYMVTTFEWRVVKCECKSMHQKDLCVRGYWTTCSIFVNHCRFKSHHNWGGGDEYDHLMSSMRIFTLTMNKMSFEPLKENGYVHNLKLPIKSHPLHVPQPTKSGVQSLKRPFNTCLPWILEACFVPPWVELSH